MKTTETSKYEDDFERLTRSIKLSSGAKSMALNARKSDYSKKDFQNYRARKLRKGHSFRNTGNSKGIHFFKFDSDIFKTEFGTYKIDFFLKPKINKDLNAQVNMLAKLYFSKGNKFKLINSEYDNFVLGNVNLIGESLEDTARKLSPFIQKSNTLKHKKYELALKLLEKEEEDIELIQKKPMRLKEYLFDSKKFYFVNKNGDLKKYNFSVYFEFLRHSISEENNLLVEENNLILQVNNGRRLKEHQLVYSLKKISNIETLLLTHRNIDGKGIVDNLKVIYSSQESYLTNEVKSYLSKKI